MRFILNISEHIILAGVGSAHKLLTSRAPVATLFGQFVSRAYVVLLRKK